MPEYYNVTTNLGDAEIANAIAANTKLNITHIAFGDGNGSVPTPTKTRTSLVREVHRQAVTKYERHATNANWIVIETIIPSDIGGFTIREMGIIANGKLISHGSHAPFEKVADPSGVSEYRLRFTQNVTDGSVVELTLDQSLIYATQAWIDENYIKRSEIVDNLTTNDATKVASAKQVKILQDNKLELEDLKDASTEQKGITQLVNDLTTGGTDKALTAEQGKLMLSMFANLLTLNGYVKIPNPANLGKPLILQWGEWSATTSSVTFPIAFPTAGLCAVSTAKTNSYGGISSLTKTTMNLPTATGASRFLAVGY